MVEEYVLVGCLGLALGSFLNVCIFRVPKRKSVLWPRSFCPHCRRPLRVWENIPVLSFLWLRGHCRQCRHPIGWVHPTVEVSTAVLMLVLFDRFGLQPALFVNALFFSLLVVLVFIDLFERLLPDVITLSGTGAGFLLSSFQTASFFQDDSFLSRFEPFWIPFAGSLLGIVAGGGILWLVAILYLRIRKIEGLGFGDIKMMALVGAFLGWRYAWLTILMGSLLGVVLGSLYMLLSGRGRRYELPFGTFLGIAALGVTLWGPELLDWYFSFLEKSL